MGSMAASRRRTDLSASPFHTASQKLGYPTERELIARQQDSFVHHPHYDAASGSAIIWVTSERMHKIRCELVILRFVEDSHFFHECK
jgi:hypothetical protein